MKALHIALIYVCSMISGFAGEALGIKYDDVYLVRLKHPQASKKKAVIFNDDGKPSSMVEGAYKMQRSAHKKVETLFDAQADFNHGKADSRLQLYSLVFYRDGKSVLIISPNLTGGDLYASDVNGYDPRSFSTKQRGEFMNIVLRCLGNLQESTDLPKK
ncbi:hypothetical protein JIN77_10655 [Verrucomicrobiaceae bacterium R5-34]|nr:hypothetical protein [Verrucomicrobiaceae bacterium R5-34]